MKYDKLLILYLMCYSIINFIYCQSKPALIEYGHDDCSFCKMTIVDKAHSAQIVTKKGKQYKFDAIECMIRKIGQEPQLGDKAIMLVADYSKPGTMIDAKMAIYIISPRIKSPMGENLSAVQSKDFALKLQKDFGGEKYDFTSLKKHLLP